MKSIALFFVSCVLVSCSLSNSVRQIETKLTDDERLVNNIEAFKKLYGYVRYFHPTEETLAIDWLLFALYGVSQVKGARSVDELKDILNRLFQPITHGLSIYFKSETPPMVLSNGHPMRAWQHLGLGGRY